MIVALKKLGVKVEWESNMQTLVVHGSGGKLALPGSELYMGSEATASRFMTTAVNLIESEGSVLITGNKRMHERPTNDLVQALQASGCSIEYIRKDGSLPLKIDTSAKGWNGGPINLAADVSSQFVSSIIISAPYAKNQVTQTLTLSLILP